MLSFKEFCLICDAFNDYPLGVVMPNTAFGATTGPSPAYNGSPIAPHQTDFDLGMPTVTKTAQIQQLDDKRNPISMYLSDGTRLFLPYDAFKKIKGEPRVGKTVSVVFQRRPDDQTATPSQIQSIECF